MERRGSPIAKKGTRQVNRHKHGEENVNLWLAHRKQCEDPPLKSPEDELHVRFAVPKSIASSSSESSIADSPNYTDGGYGWVVVTFSFFLHFIMDGLSFSFGLIFALIQTKFEANRTESSLVASLFLSLPLLCSVVAGVFNDLQDCRRTIMFGGTICFFSCIGAFFSESLFGFTLFFGVGCGIGLSFLYNAALVVVTYYFNEKIGKATSFATLGTGVGTFCYPFYLTNFRGFLAWLGWRLDELGSMIVACALSFFICIVIGYALRDVEWTTDTTEYKIRKFEKDVRKLREEEDEPATIFADFPVRRACSLPSIPTIIYSKLRADSTSVQSVKETVESYIAHPARSRSIGIFIRRQALPPVPEYSMIQNELDHLKHLDLEIGNSPNTTVKSNRKQMTSRLSMSVDQINEIEDGDDIVIRTHPNSSTHSYSGTHDNMVDDEDGTSSSSNDSDLSNDGDSSSSELSERVEQIKLMGEKKEIVSARSNEAAINPIVPAAPSSARYFRNSLAQGMGGITAGRVMAGNVLQQRIPFKSNLLSVGKVPSAPSLRDRKKRRNMFLGNKIGAVVTSVADVIKQYATVIRVPVFQIFLVNLAFLYMVLDVPYVYFIDVAVDDLLVPEHRARWLTSAIGVSNIGSTLFYGLLADVQFIKERLLLFYGLFLSVSTVSMLVAYFYMSFTGLLFACFLFGASVSCNYVWQSIHVTLIFKDMASFQPAYSLATTSEGIANFVGPIVCGIVRDKTGSYSFVFVIAAVMTAASSIFAIIAHFRLQEERSAEDDDDEYELSVVNGQSRQPIENQYAPEASSLIQKL